MMFRASRLVAGIVIGLLGVGLALWGQGAPRSGPADMAAAQVLYVQLSADDISTLDCARTPGTAQVYIPSKQINRTLLEYVEGAADYGQVAGCLAESWEVSEDGLTWTFHLLPNVQFHKGFGELTAEDVVFSFERLAEIGSPIASYYDGIKFETVDKYTFRMILDEIRPFFETYLADIGRTGPVYIVSKKAAEYYGDSFGMNPVGVGPFEFLEHRPKDRIILVAHDEYFRGRPLLDRVEFLLIPNESSAMQAFLNGSVHILSWTANVDVATTIARQVPNAIIRPHGMLSFNPWQVHFRMTKPPLDDLAVRQALTYAINKQDYQDYFGVAYMEYVSPIPAQVLGGLSSKDLPEELLYSYDLDKARGLLREAGYPLGFKLQAVVSSSGSYRISYEILAAQWREIGVELELTFMDNTSYQAQVRADVGDIVFFPGMRPLPTIILEQYFHSKAIVGKPTAVTNFSHYGDVDADGDGVIDSIDGLFDLVVASRDISEQKMLLRDAQLQLLEHLPAFPVYLVSVLSIFQPNVELGYDAPNTPGDWWHLDRAYIRR